MTSTPIPSDPNLEPDQTPDVIPPEAPDTPDVDPAELPETLPLPERP